MTVKEIVECWNGETSSTDREIVQCKYCGLYSFWGGYKDDPPMWECEECGVIFCKKCVETDYVDILCNECKNKGDD